MDVLTQSTTSMEAVTVAFVLQPGQLFITHITSMLQQVIRSDSPIQMIYSPT